MPRYRGTFRLDGRVLSIRVACGKGACAPGPARARHGGGGYFTWTAPGGRTYQAGPDTYPV